MTYFADYLNSLASTELAEVKAALEAKFPKVNVSTAIPTAANDSSQGYSVNSKWLNTATGIEYICRDVSVGAARWVRQDNADFYGYVSGRYYHGMVSVVAAGAAVTANSIRMHPIIIKERVTISELGVRVTTAEAAKNFQLAIYASDPATKLPTGNALSSTANISSAATGVMTAALGANVTLEPGMYWVGILGDIATAVFQAFGSNNTNAAVILGGTASQVASGTTSSIAHLAVTHTFGTWPDLTAGSFTYGNSSAYAAIFFKVA
jgi:hypothetical protein